MYVPFDWYISTCRVLLNVFIEKLRCSTSLVSKTGAKGKRIFNRSFVLYSSVIHVYSSPYGLSTLVIASRTNKEPATTLRTFQLFKRRTHKWDNDDGSCWMHMEEMNAEISVEPRSECTASAGNGTIFVRSPPYTCLYRQTTVCCRSICTAWPQDHHVPLLSTSSVTALLVLYPAQLST
jgi:hypothetical protein